MFSVDERVLLQWIDPAIPSSEQAIHRCKENSGLEFFGRIFKFFWLTLFEISFSEKQLRQWDDARMDILSQFGRRQLKIGVLFAQSGAQVND